jgi:hypothetical protein
LTASRTFVPLVRSLGVRPIVVGGSQLIGHEDPLVFVGCSYAFEDNGIRPGDAFGFSLGTVLVASPETSLWGFSSIMPAS